MSRYRHRVNGNTYIVEEGYRDFTVKQGSNNQWEPVIVYRDEKTMQPFITGLKRFSMKFELIANNKQ